MQPPLLVKDALSSNTWQQQCRGILTTTDMREIQSMERVLNQEANRCVWTCSSDGNFTIQTAWEMCRTHGHGVGCAKSVWHHCVPLKWSFLTWRAIHSRLPLDDCLIRKGFQLVSKCGCCINSQVETIHHVFVNCPTARQVWATFEDICDITCVGFLLQ